MRAAILFIGAAVRAAGEVCEVGLSDGVAGEWVGAAEGAALSHRRWLRVCGLCVRRGARARGVYVRVLRLVVCVRAPTGLRRSVLLVGATGEQRVLAAGLVWV